MTKVLFIIQMVQPLFNEARHIIQELCENVSYYIHGHLSHNYLLLCTSCKSVP